jgi:hypothetical protein
MTTLSELCPRGRFDSPWKYSQFIRSLNSLIAEGRIRRIEPTIRSQWDSQAEFFYDPLADEVFRLHHPEAPSRGEWVRVSKDYLEDPTRSDH